MILTRLRVFPFGFFADREVSLHPGLNVLLGPNEAGKSTLFNAIKNCFLRSSLTRKDFEQFISRFVPVGGGDTARVELSFRTGRGEYRLRRVWGPRPSSELALPEGGAILEDDAVGTALESLLPASRAVFWKVLMTGQAELLDTLDTLKTDGKTLAGLTGLLRSAILSSGGVSAESFRALLADRLRASFLSWDRARRYPEGNRGIENPRQKSVGEILASWYTMEGTRSRLAAARKYEADLDAVNARLRAVLGEIARTEAFVSSSRKAAEDARIRQTLEARRDAVLSSLERLRTDNRQWPVAEEKIAELDERLPVLETARTPLEDEKTEALREEENRGLREKHARVSRRKAALEEAEKALSGVPRLIRRDLEEIARVSGNVERLRAGSEAGALRVSVAARNNLQLSVQEDMNPERRAAIPRGKVAGFTAGGRLRIVHPDFEIEILSGAGDAGAGREALHQAEAKCAELASLHGVSGVADAEMRCREYEGAASAAEAARRALAEELAGETLEALERRVGGIGQARTVRNAAVVAEELARLIGEIESAKRDRQEWHRRLADLESAYGTQEELVDRLARDKGTETDLASRLRECAPLPEGFPDADAFIRAFEKSQKDLERLREERGGLSTEKARMEAREPAESVAELQGALEEEQKNYQAAEQRGEALQRISGATEALLGESDTVVSARIQADLQEMVSVMTGHRYQRVEMSGALPLSIARSEGAWLKSEILSAGTRDTLALALRLTMASHFLGEAPGFVMMDDPLVEMDPERQRAAAEVLKTFGAKKQVLVFTCHPSHAAFLTSQPISV